MKCEFDVGDGEGESGCDVCVVCGVEIGDWDCE